MPPRVTVVDFITRWLHGGVYYTFGVIEPEGNDGMTDDRWDDLLAESDDLFVSIMMSLDWQRVMIAAVGRHLYMVDKGIKHGMSEASVFFEDTVCDECVREAVLLDSRNESWGVTPRNETLQETEARLARMSARESAARAARKLGAGL